MAKSKIALRQGRFRGGVFHKADLLDHLRAQWSLSYAVEMSRRADDPAQLHAEVERLDLELLRCAISQLQGLMNEVAVDDAASLVTQRVLDTDAKQPSLETWVDWLEQAPCWPQLVQQNWREVVTRVEDRVLDSMNNDGVTISKEAKQDLITMLRMLSLQDSLPADEFERLFLAGGDDESATD